MPDKTAINLIDSRSKCKNLKDVYEAINIPSVKNLIHFSEQLSTQKKENQIKQERTGNMQN